MSLPRYRARAACFVIRRCISTHILAPHPVRLFVCSGTFIPCFTHLFQQDDAPRNLFAVLGVPVCTHPIPESRSESGSLPPLPSRAGSSVTSISTYLLGIPRIWMLTRSVFCCLSAFFTKSLSHSPAFYFRFQD